MTTAVQQSSSDPAAPQTHVAPEILDRVTGRASVLDRGEEDARDVFPDLGDAGLLDLGAPRNHDGRLPEMAGVLTELAGQCMSTAFSAWANRMAVEYLRSAATPTAQQWADTLGQGRRLGITGMAAAFRDAAGCGSLELSASRVDGGWSVSGPIRWSSNLYEDSLLVTSARTDTGEKIIFARPLASEGITTGKPFSLLALTATASSSLTLDEVAVADEDVLTTDFAPFLAGVRPSFLLLQTALCVGLASTCLREAREGLVGVNSVFTADADTLDGRLALARSSLFSMARAVGSDHEPSRKELLSLRLAAADLATSSASLESRTAGGRGYARSTPTSRRAREAQFFPVQSPSEGQLRWELASC